MSKICPICNKEWPDDFMACPLDSTTLVDKQQHAGISLNLGDANAISGGIHVSDSHNISNIDQRVINTSNVHNITNNVTQYAARSEMEILQEKKSVFLEECKKAYEDNVLEPSELVALESCRLSLGLDKDVADQILESARQLSLNQNRSTELPVIAKLKLNRLLELIQNNDIPTLLQQIEGFESLAKSYTNDELQFNYWLVLASLKHEQCIEQFKTVRTDNYWMSFWTYFAFLKVNNIAGAGNILYTIKDKFPSTPDSNISIMATAGSILQNDSESARKYFLTIGDDYSPLLKQLVQALLFCLHREEDLKISDSNRCVAFYLEKILGKTDNNQVSPQPIIRGILKVIYDGQNKKYTKPIIVPCTDFFPEYYERVKIISLDIAKIVYQNCLREGMSGNRVMAKKALVHIILKRGAPISIEQNPQMLDTLFMKFADEYDLQDLISYMVSQIYFKRINIPNANQELVKWLEFGSKKGNVECLITLATRHLLEGEVGDSLDLLSTYANQGNIYCVDWLVNMYKYGEPKDVKKVARILADLDVKALKKVYEEKDLLKKIKNFHNL